MRYITKAEKWTFAAVVMFFIYEASWVTSMFLINEGQWYYNTVELFGALYITVMMSWLVINFPLIIHIAAPEDESKRIRRAQVSVLVCSPVGPLVLVVLGVAYIAKKILPKVLAQST